MIRTSVTFYKTRYKHTEENKVKELLFKSEHTAQEISLIMTQLTAKLIAAISIDPELHKDKWESLDIIMLDTDI